MRFTPHFLTCLFLHFGRLISADFYQRLQICENELVQVSSISVICNTPITWSYTRGSHRNSATCDYSDYANITVTFDVVDDYGSDIYVDMNAYSDQDDLLYQSGSKSLCGVFVESDCSSQGSYSFVKSIQFGSGAGNASGFVPVIEMAFSSAANGGNDLGGANLDSCPEEGDGNDYSDVEDEEEIESSENDSSSAQQSGGAAQGGSRDFPLFIILTALFAVVFVVTLAGFAYGYKSRASKKVPTEFKEALMEKGQNPDNSITEPIKVVDVVPSTFSGFEPPALSGKAKQKELSIAGGDDQDLAEAGVPDAVVDEKNDDKQTINTSKDKDWVLDNVELSRMTANSELGGIERKLSDDDYSM